MFVPTPDVIGERLHELAGISKRVQHLKDKSSVRLEKLLADHMLEVTTLYEYRLKEGKNHPSRYLYGMIHRINYLMTTRLLPEEQRFALLRETLAHSGQLLAVVTDLAKGLPADERQLIADALDKVTASVSRASSQVRKHFASSNSAKLDTLSGQFDNLAKQASSSQADLKQLASDNQPQESVEYREILDSIYGVDLDQLLLWYQDEVARCNDQLAKIAKDIDPKRSPLEILDQDLPACDSPESMFQLIEECVALARETCQQYVTLPPGEHCGVEPVADHLKDHYPWGGYSYDGNLLKGDLIGHVFLNQHNYKAIGKGWIRMNAVHECYAGHHVHAVKTAAADMPLTFKLGNAVPLSEGICMRTETLLQDIFADPVYPLFVAYRRLHTAVRIWADLLLHHFKEGADAAIGLYMKYLGLTRTVSKGQVNSQLITPGYFTTYYYGLMDLEKLQSECKWDDKNFTELIFSCGKISLKNLRRLITLPEKERLLLCQRFSGIE